MVAPEKPRTGAPGVRWPPVWLAACLSLVLACTETGLAQPPEREDPALEAMRQKMVAASTPAPTWAGPRSGPPGSPGKSVAIISEDLRNGGVLGVALGVREAAGVMGWKVTVFDAAGTPSGRSRAAEEAWAYRPDGLILVGTDAEEMGALLRPFTRHQVPIVGWHVGPRAGALSHGPVAINVSTDPLEVARIAASAVVVASGGKAGVVIFTDANFEIAMAKARAMAEVVRACDACALLEVREVAISRAAEEMPGVTDELLARHGARWTHALAVNDIYFDHAVPRLLQAGVPTDRIGFYSAGDGSPSAFMRIQTRIFQEGTVAEPLNLQGWQLVDELNRLLARRPVSGHVVPVHLVTRGNMDADGGSRLQYDPENEYRDIYRRIWNP